MWEQLVGLPLESREVFFVFSHYRVMDVVRHLAERQYFDSVLSCHHAVVCEIDEVISVAIEQDTMVGTPLIAVVHDSLIKYPTLHIIQHN